MEQEIINNLAEIFGNSGRYAINEYAKWYISSSIVWISIGLILIGSCFKVKYPEDWDVHPLVIKMICFFIGLMFIGCNVPDLIAPEAMAIHRIILDITGK